MRRKGPPNTVGLVSACLYLWGTLVSNVLSTKITVLPWFRLAVDGGTIIYPLTFTFRDFVHKTLGKRDARYLVVITAALNLLMFGFFWLIGQAPADPSWPHQQAYEEILLPLGRIVAASIIAQVVSELVDTEVFSAVYRRLRDVMASLVSNVAGTLVDSVLFGLIAFWGALPAQVVGQIILSNVLIKLVVGVLSAPTIKLIPRLAPDDEM